MGHTGASLFERGLQIVREGERLFFVPFTQVNATIWREKVKDIQTEGEDGEDGGESDNGNNTLPMREQRKGIHREKGEKESRNQERCQDPRRCHKWLESQRKGEKSTAKNRDQNESRSRHICDVILSMVGKKKEIHCVSYPYPCQYECSPSKWL